MVPQRRWGSLGPHNTTAYKPDIFALTETKLNSEISNNEICKNYSLYRYDRPNDTGRGGGLLIGISDACPISVNSINKCSYGEKLLYFASTTEDQLSKALMTLSCGSPVS